MSFVRIASLLRGSRRPARVVGFACSRPSLARLLSSLAIIEQRDGQLQSASLSAITAARKLGGSITGIVAGSIIRKPAEEAAKIEGLDKILMIENGAYDKVGLFV